MLGPPSIPDGPDNSFHTWWASWAKISGRPDPGNKKPRRANHTGRDGEWGG
jgi:hypothetical protein